MNNNITQNIICIDNTAYKKYSSYYPNTLNQYLKTMIMKRIITFLLAFSCLFTASAQAPQAVCYQGVATDQQGRELISQNIRVRLSILKTSTAGAEEWIETHSVTTDGFGLFDLPIGNGTRTGGAVGFYPFFCSCC